MKSVGSKHCNDPKDYIEYSGNMDDIYGNIDQQNQNPMIDYMIAYMLSS